jgi:flagellar protein FlgJ
MSALKPKMAPEAFIAFVLSSALATQAASRVPAGFTVAQAAVESDWDGSALSQEDFNFFGVKAIGGWAGPSQMWPTQEFLQGHYVTIQAPFRKYASMTEGFEDHAAFLTGNERYAGAFAHADGSIAFARAVAAAGYATDPHYADTIVAIIVAHDLTRYDAA